jgi:Bacterial Ig-like domain (group 2)
MPKKAVENKPGESWLSKEIITVTTIVVALTGLFTALVHFRDSIPWLTPVATIEVVPNPLNLAISDKFQVVATVRDSNKNPLGKNVKWSSANPSLVEIDSDGIVTGNAAGETTITASIGFIKGLAPVHVRRVNVAVLEVFPPATTLQVDDHLKFDATPYDSEGNSLMGRPVRWASENNSVASVEQSSGDTTGKSAGTVKVTADSEGKLNAAMVTVNPKPPPPTTPTVISPPAPASPPPPAGQGARVGAVVGRVAAARPPMAAVVRLPPAVASASRAMTLAFAEKITLVNGVKTGGCPANLRILIGETLIDVKSDPQEAVHISLGDQPYNLHGTVSCPHQNVAVVNGHGTISIVNGKTYRCAWRQKGPKDFEIALQPQ